MRVKRLKMVQVHKANWQIENLKGTVLVENITLGLYAEAEEYIKRYVSSWLEFEYEMVPLTKQGEK